MSARGPARHGAVLLGADRVPSLLYVGEFHDIVSLNNLGLAESTGLARDTGKFRVPPTLRNVEPTGPYMHDGSIATLGEVIDHYAADGRSPKAPTQAWGPSVRTSIRSSAPSTSPPTSARTWSSSSAPSRTTPSRPIPASPTRLRSEQRTTYRSEQLARPHPVCYPSPSASTSSSSSPKKCPSSCSTVISTCSASISSSIVIASRFA